MVARLASSTRQRSSAPAKAWHVSPRFAGARSAVAMSSTRPSALRSRVVGSEDPSASSTFDAPSSTGCGATALNPAMMPRTYSSPAPGPRSRSEKRTSGHSTVSAVASRSRTMHWASPGALAEDVASAAVGIEAAAKDASASARWVGEGVPPVNHFTQGASKSHGVVQAARRDGPDSALPRRAGRR